MIFYFCPTIVIIIRSPAVLRFDFCANFRPCRRRVIPSVAAAVWPTWKKSKKNTRGLDFFFCIFFFSFPHTLPETRNRSGPTRTGTIHGPYRVVTRPGNDTPAPPGLSCPQHPDNTLMPVIVSNLFLISTGFQPAAADAGPRRRRP